MKTLPEVVLKKGEDNRIFGGHPWVYDNEIEQISEEYENGGLFLFKNHEGLYIGLGYINEKSVITGRMLDVLKKPVEVYTAYADIETLLDERITTAIKKREKIKNTNAIRYIYSEADMLPGLIVDMYNDTMVIQITTLGMDKLKDKLVKILDEKLNPKVIFEKSLSQSRIKEGLEKVENVIKGEINPVIIEENGIKFEVNTITGSKTGFYIDQRDNRERIREFVKDKTVLDLFCYSGGFSAYASKAGALLVKAVDSSAAAINSAAKNMELNGIKNVTLIKGDVFDELKSMVNKNEKYDVVILDPPPFSKAKEEKTGGIKGYKDLHAKAIKLMKEDGILITFSCSHNISMSDLIRTVKDAARRLRRKVEVKAQLFQAKDHPYNTAIPETFYLKGAILRIY